MEDVSETFKNYFFILENLCLLWETSGKKVSKPLAAIENYSEQLQAMSGIDDEFALHMQFPDLKEKITFMTFMRLEQELLTVIQLAKEIGDTTERLNDLAMRLDQQIGSSANSVSAHTLLEAVSDCRQYYQARSSSLQISIKCLDYRKWHTITELRKSFSEDQYHKPHLEKCVLLLKYSTLEADLNMIQHLQSLECKEGR